MSRPEPLRTLPEQAFRARARLVALLLCGICFAGLIARLYWLQLAAGDWYTRRALGQQLRDTVVPADRGRIYSADGVLLAANSSCWTCGPARGRCLPTNWSWPPTVLRRFWSWTKPPCWKSSGTAPPTTVCCATGWSVPWRCVRDFCEENGITGIRINQDSKRWYAGEVLASVLALPMWTTPE